MNHDRRRRWTVWIGVTLALAAVGGSSFAAQDGAVEGEAAPVRHVKMYVEEWKWSPKVLRVAVGTKVILDIKSFDAPHSFELKAFDLDVPLPQDKTTRVEFVADRAGKFRWRCGRPCGNGCPKLSGKLIVD